MNWSEILKSFSPEHPLPPQPQTTYCQTPPPSTSPPPPSPFSPYNLYSLSPPSILPPAPQQFSLPQKPEIPSMSLLQYSPPKEQLYIPLSIPSLYSPPLAPLSKPLSQLNGWTDQEIKQFHKAMDEWNGDSDLHEYIATRLPGKTIKEVQEYMLEEVINIKPVDPPMLTHDFINHEVPTEDSSTTPEKKQRRKCFRWTEEEHRLFLKGLKKCGPGNWKLISKKYVKTKKTSQVASHAQKYFQRIKSKARIYSRRPSILDIQIEDSLEIPQKMQYKPIAPSPFPRTTHVFPRCRNSYSNIEGPRSVSNQDKVLSIPTSLVVPSTKIPYCLNYNYSFQHSSSFDNLGGMSNMQANMGFPSMPFHWIPSFTNNCTSGHINYPSSSRGNMSFPFYEWSGVRNINYPSYASSSCTPLNNMMNENALVNPRFESSIVEWQGNV